jgi:hypothetical protein
VNRSGCLHRDRTVRVDRVWEAIARKLHGIARVPLDEQERMIRRAAKAGAKALRETNEENGE